MSYFELKKGGKIELKKKKIKLKTEKKLIKGGKWKKYLYNKKIFSYINFRP